METTTETSAPSELLLPVKLGTEVYGEGKKVVNLSFAQFTNDAGGVDAGQEKVKPKRIVVFPMGWPWDASAKATYDFPGQIAKGLDTTCLSISTRSQRDNPEGLALQGEAMYQCLLKNGLDQETQLIIIGHSAGALKGAYLDKVLEDNGFKPALFILVSPMGLNSRSTVGLLKDFLVDTFWTGKKERQKGGVRAGDKNPVAEKVTEQEIQAGFKDSLRKKWQAGGVRGLWSQIKSLVTKDPIFSQIKVPVVDLANDRDMVSNHRSYLPEEAVRNNVAPLTPEADARARQNERVQIARAREQIAREIFKQAESVKVVVPTRQADHNGIPVARGEQVPSLIKRVLSLAERAARRAT